MLLKKKFYTLKLFIVMLTVFFLHPVYSNSITPCFIEGTYCIIQDDNQIIEEIKEINLNNFRDVANIQYINTPPSDSGPVSIQTTAKIIKVSGINFAYYSSFQLMIDQSFATIKKLLYSNSNDGDNLTIAPTDNNHEVLVEDLSLWSSSTIESALNIKFNNPLGQEWNIKITDNDENNDGYLFPNENIVFTSVHKLEISSLQIMSSDPLYSTLSEIDILKLSDLDYQITEHTVSLNFGEIENLILQNVFFIVNNAEETEQPYVKVDIAATGSVSSVNLDYSDGDSINNNTTICFIFSTLLGIQELKLSNIVSAIYINKEVQQNAINITLEHAPNTITLENITNIILDQDFLSEIGKINVVSSSVQINLNKISTNSNLSVINDSSIVTFFSDDNEAVTLPNYSGSGNGTLTIQAGNVLSNYPIKVNTLIVDGVLSLQDSNLYATSINVLQGKINFLGFSNIYVKNFMYITDLIIQDKGTITIEGDNDDIIYTKIKIMNLEGPGQFNLEMQKSNIQFDLLNSTLQNFYITINKNNNILNLYDVQSMKQLSILGDNATVNLINHTEEDRRRDYEPKPYNIDFLNIGSVKFDIDIANNNLFIQTLQLSNISEVNIHIKYSDLQDNNYGFSYADIKNIFIKSSANGGEKPKINIHLDATVYQLLQGDIILLSIKDSSFTGDSIVLNIPDLPLDYTIDYINQNYILKSQILEQVAAQANKKNRSIASYIDSLSNNGILPDDVSTYINNPLVDYSLDDKLYNMKVYDISPTLFIIDKIYRDNINDVANNININNVFFTAQLDTIKYNEYNNSKTELNLNHYLASWTGQVANKIKINIHGSYSTVNEDNSVFNISIYDISSIISYAMSTHSYIMTGVEFSNSNTEKKQFYNNTIIGYKYSSTINAIYLPIVYHLELYPNDKLSILSSLNFTYTKHFIKDIDLKSSVIRDIEVEVNDNSGYLFLYNIDITYNVLRQSFYIVNLKLNLSQQYSSLPDIKTYSKFTSVSSDESFEEIYESYSSMITGARLGVDINISNRHYVDLSMGAEFSNNPDYTVYSIKLGYQYRLYA